MKGIRVIATYSCNFMCSICKYKCAPFKKGYMCVEEFYYKFTHAYDEGYRDYIIIEGGEVFLNIAHIYKYLKKIKGFDTKKYIVTNGYWGNIDIYYSTLKDLYKIGVSGLIFEYDYFHSIYMDLDTLFNAIDKTIKNNLSVTLKAYLKTNDLSCNEDLLTIKLLKSIKDRYKDIKIIFDAPDSEPVKSALNKRWTLEEKLILYDK